VTVLVSINCITYNQENYIGDAIEGFLMQITDFNYEILIGEDCSSDNTKKIVEEYVKNYPDKIKMITSEQNVGARKNSQRLIDMSKGKYIADCEGDDYWIDPYKLQKQVDYMEEHPACTLCLHAAEIIKAPNKKIGRVHKPYNGNKICPMEDIISRGGGFCATATLFYPKKLMENPPDFYVHAPVGDYPMQMFLASQGYAYYMDDCMAVYRSGVEGSWNKRMISGRNVREKIILVNEGLVQILDGFDKYTNNQYSSEIEKNIQKIKYELYVLKRKGKERKNTGLHNYTWWYKSKVRMKIFIRCYFPTVFLMLADYKDTKSVNNQYLKTR
jgi:glycosyltransferase involved in cell wall biosynthesis